MDSPGRIRRLWQALREAIVGSQRDLTDVPLSRAVILLAVPMVLEMAMESIFAVVDIFFVTRLGEDAISSVRPRCRSRCSTPTWPKTRPVSRVFCAR